MKIKIQIKSVFGKVLFELEKENNTIKETLEQAVKENADLEGADLRNADLINSNLEGANLKGAKNKETAILPIFCKWSYGIKGDLIIIGCKQKTIEEWDIWFNSNDEYSISRGTEEFKQIEAIYNALKYYYLTLNK